MRERPFSFQPPVQSFDAGKLQCTAFRGIAAVHLQQLVQGLNWLAGLISSVSQADVQAPIVLTFQKHHFRVCRGHHLGSGLAAVGVN